MNRPPVFPSDKDKEIAPGVFRRYEAVFLTPADTVAILRSRLSNMPDLARPEAYEDGWILFGWYDNTHEVLS